jgi:branched-chain amino acid transport system ATP-binding protein
LLDESAQSKSAAAGALGTERSSSANDVVLRASGVTRSFGGAVVLDGVSLELRQGEVVLLRGDNGSGKTTLLNILTGSLEPDSGSIEVTLPTGHERFAFPKRWWQAFNPVDQFTPERVARSGISRTWQEIRLFSSQDLRDNIALATPRLRGENPLSVLFSPFAVRRETQRTDAQAQALLDRFGLGGREHSLADRVSLGQSKRVAIARSIQAGAKILFLDEPLAGLDGPGIRDVIEFLSDLVRAGDVTLVIVEHVFNIPLILKLATVVWTLASGRITVESPDEAYADATAPDGGDLTKWLKDVAGPAGSVSHVELPGGALLSTIERSPEAESKPPALEFKNVVVRRGRTPIIGRQHEDGSFEGLSFALREGTLATLQAPNGWGKTTLLEAMAGFISVHQGSIAIDGYAVERETSWSRTRRGLSILQSRYHSFDNLSVAETLHLARAGDRSGDFLPILKRRVGDLSGGQKQRIAIAAAMADSKARVRVLDEPFSMLDAATIDRVRAIVAERKREATLILVPAARAF